MNKKRSNRPFRGHGPSEDEFVFEEVSMEDSRSDDSRPSGRKSARGASNSESDFEWKDSESLNEQEIDAMVAGFASAQPQARPGRRTRQKNQRAHIASNPSVNPMKTKTVLVDGVKVANTRIRPSIEEEMKSHGIKKLPSGISAADLAIPSYDSVVTASERRPLDCALFHEFKGEELSPLDEMMRKTQEKCGKGKRLNAKKDEKQDARREDAAKKSEKSRKALKPEGKPDSRSDEKTDSQNAKKAEKQNRPAGEKADSRKRVPEAKADRKPDRRDRKSENHEKAAAVPTQASPQSAAQSQPAAPAAFVPGTVSPAYSVPVMPAMAAPQMTAVLPAGTVVSGAASMDATLRAELLKQQEVLLHMIHQCHQTLATIQSQLLTPTVPAGFAAPFLSVASAIPAVPAPAAPAVPSAPVMTVPEPAPASAPAFVPPAPAAVPACSETSPSGSAEAKADPESGLKTPASELSQADSETGSRKLSRRERQRLKKHHEMSDGNVSDALEAPAGEAEDSEEAALESKPDFIKSESPERARDEKFPHKNSDSKNDFDRKKPHREKNESEKNSERNLERNSDRNSDQDFGREALRNTKPNADADSRKNRKDARQPFFPDPLSESPEDFVIFDEEELVSEPFEKPERKVSERSEKTGKNRKGTEKGQNSENAPTRSRAETSEKPQKDAKPESVSKSENVSKPESAGKSENVSKSEKTGKASKTEKSEKAARGLKKDERLRQLQDSEFGKMGLSKEILFALDDAQYATPSRIQMEFIPEALTGEDVMGQAQTGTGKTAAFAIPILQMIKFDEDSFDPQALILVPTRELAVQVKDEFEKLAKYSDLECLALYGGKPLPPQVQQLKAGVDIVIGTPGRIMDHIKRGSLKLGKLKISVLDEADRMLDIGFRPDIEKILRMAPQSRQSLLLSATIPSSVEAIARKYMRDPKVLDCSQKEISSETIEQFYFTVDPELKFDLLLKLIERENPTQAIIFCRTKRGVERICTRLARKIESVEAIHGDLQQRRRDRVMASFRAGKTRYLVATDVVGRGIDVSGISHIINYDIPKFCDDYVHRVGRTGRMGHEGVAFTFVAPEEGNELTRIEMRINQLLKRDEIPGFASVPPMTSAAVAHEVESAENADEPKTAPRRRRRL